jgi:hypothetical protein
MPGAPSLSRFMRQGGDFDLGDVQYDASPKMQYPIVILSEAQTSKASQAQSKDLCGSTQESGTYAGCPILVAISATGWEL